MTEENKNIEVKSTTLLDMFGPGIEKGDVEVIPNNDGSATIRLNYTCDQGLVETVLTAQGDDAALLTGLAEEKKKS